MDSEIAWEDCITDLPPLSTLSPSSPNDLPDVELLDLFSLDSSASNPPTKPTFDHPLDHPIYNPPLSDLSTEKLSHCTSTTNSHHSTPSDTSTTLHDNAPSSNPSPPCSPDPDLISELNTRLKSAVSETSALRKRVAALTAENRGLRQALDHANARLVAVAQAASQPATAPPVVLGLAHVSTDVAKRLTSALTVSDSHDDTRDRKKRKRMTGAATTMACVMFMWGAFVGTPGLFKSGSGSTRTDGNLPAVWSGAETAVAPAIPRLAQVAPVTWQPECLRKLKQLPSGTNGEGDDRMEVVKEEPVVAGRKQETDRGDKMFVDVKDEKAANVVARADVKEREMPDYSYVLCRDAANAVNSVKACARRMESGETCGQPHTISLILPAGAAGVGGENGTESGMELAEVQCTITSVGRIPYPDSGSPKTKVGRAGKGRVIATVPEVKMEGTKTN